MGHSALARRNSKTEVRNFAQVQTFKMFKSTSIKNGEYEMATETLLLLVSKTIIATNRLHPKTSMRHTHVHGWNDKQLGAEKSFKRSDVYYKASLEIGAFKVSAT
jgi:hypothetical protein